MNGLLHVKEKFKKLKENIKGQCIVASVKNSSGITYHILTRAKKNSNVFITLCDRIITKDEIKEIEEFENIEFLIETVNQSSTQFRRTEEEWFCINCAKTLLYLCEIGFYNPSDLKILHLKKKKGGK